MAFYPGQKVVCVDDGPVWDDEIDGGLLHYPLKRGEVYTVNRVDWARWDPENCPPEPHEILSLREADNPLGSGGFASVRFRPVQPKSTETGMSILRKIADGSPVREGIDA